MKRNNRMGRVNDEIAKELAMIIRGELKDPRIGVLTTVTRVETTQDLKYCKAFVSILGNDEEKENVMQGLKSAAGYIRHLLAERINLRITPEISFKIDDSLDHSIKMSKLLNEISSQRTDLGETENE